MRNPGLAALALFLISCGGSNDAPLPLIDGSWTHLGTDDEITLTVTGTADQLAGEGKFVFPQNEHFVVSGSLATGVVFTFDGNGPDAGHPMTFHRVNATATDLQLLFIDAADSGGYAFSRDR